MAIQDTLMINTVGRGMINITDQVNAVVAKMKVSIGLCHIFIHHTSASLLVTENQDPDVLADLESFMQKIIPDGSPLFKHQLEGPDDMPSHIRSVLTQHSLSIPVCDGKLLLGVWQGIFLWEHRFVPFERKLTITVIA